MPSNRHVLIDRTRAAARRVYEAVEESRACVAEYAADGGSAYTDPFFYVDEDTGGTLRTDLEFTKDQLVAAQVALNAIANGAMAPGATINDYLPALSKVK